MTNQIPADMTPEDMAHARAYVQDVLDAKYIPDRIRAVARVLNALLPAPPRPTLAYMNDDERAACQWMQCNVKGMQGRRIIAYPGGVGESVGVLVPFGHLADVEPRDVTPLPHLPRLTWPGDAPAPAAPALPEGWRLADHEGYGRVIVTRPEPDDAGGVAITKPVTTKDTRAVQTWCRPDELTYLDTPDAAPESTLAVGSVWDDVDALTQACEETGRDQITVTDRDGDVSVWDAGAEWWATGAPDYGFAPYTIIHAGKKADQ